MKGRSLTVLRRAAEFAARKCSKLHTSKKPTTAKPTYKTTKLGSTVKTLRITDHEAAILFWRTNLLGKSEVTGNTKNSETFSRFTKTRRSLKHLQMHLSFTNTFTGHIGSLPNVSLRDPSFPRFFLPHVRSAREGRKKDPLAWECGIGCSNDKYSRHCVFGGFAGVWPDASIE